jgi:hypothetical protein
MKIIQLIRNGFELGIKTLQEPISEVVDHPFLVGLLSRLSRLSPLKKEKYPIFYFFNRQTGNGLNRFEIGSKVLPKICRYLLVRQIGRLFLL